MCNRRMILLEIALAIVLVWALACCSLVLGGCLSLCALRLAGGGGGGTSSLVVRHRGAYYAQKSDLYLD